MLRSPRRRATAASDEGCRRLATARDVGGIVTTGSRPWLYAVARYACSVYSGHPVHRLTPAALRWHPLHRLKPGGEVDGDDGFGVEDAGVGDHFQEVGERVAFDGEDFVVF